MEGVSFKFILDALIWDRLYYIRLDRADFSVVNICIVILLKQLLFVDETKLFTRTIRSVFRSVLVNGFMS